MKDGNFAAGFVTGMVMGKTMGGCNEDHDAIYQRGYKNGYIAGAVDAGDTGGATLGPAEDGAAELYISISTAQLREVTICFGQSADGGVRVDWGDGTVLEQSPDGLVVEMAHTYTYDGDYIIRIIPDMGHITHLGGGEDQNLNVFGIYGTGAGEGCSILLRKAVVGNGTDCVGRYAFNLCCNLQEVYIPDGVASIGAYSFQNCYSLHRMNLPDSLTSLGQYCFNGCHAIGRVSLPDNLEVIDPYCCQNCYGLQRVTMPKVKEIGLRAFSTCYGLQRLDLPATIESLIGSATNGCRNLREIRCLADTPPTMDAKIQGGHASLQIYVPAGALEAYTAATGWKDMAEKIVEEEGEL